MTKGVIRPLVIVGPSGVGKGTLIKKLMSDHPSKFGFSVSHTTRAPRPGEVHGIDYYFLPKDQMLKEIEEGQFIEHAHVHGNIYGTSAKAVKDVLDKELCFNYTYECVYVKQCILDIDVQGAMQVREKQQLNFYVIFVRPPSIEELEKRLRGRGTETEEKVQLRLKNAISELKQFDDDVDNKYFDAAIVNDKIDTSLSSLKSIISEHVFPEFEKN